MIYIYKYNMMCIYIYVCYGLRGWLNPKCFAWLDSHFFRQQPKWQKVNALKVDSADENIRVLSYIASSKTRCRKIESLAMMVYKHLYIPSMPLCHLY